MKFILILKFLFLLLLTNQSYSADTYYKVFKISEAKKDDLGNAISSIPIFGDIISKDSIKDEYLQLEYNNGKIKVSLKKKDKIFENSDVFTLKFGVSSYEFDLKSNIVNQLNENNETVKKFVLKKIIDTEILSKKINLLNEEKTNLLKELKKEKDYVQFIQDENYFLSEEKKDLIIEKVKLKREHQKKISGFSKEIVELSNQILRLQKKIDVDLKIQNKKETDKLKEKINILSTSKIKLEKIISDAETNKNIQINEFKNKITNLEKLNIKLEKENKEKDSQTEPLINKLKEAESYIAELSSDLAKEKEIVRDLKKQSLNLAQSKELKSDKNTSNKDINDKSIVNSKQDTNVVESMYSTTYVFDFEKYKNAIQKFTISNGENHNLICNDARIIFSKNVMNFIKDGYKPKISQMEDWLNNFVPTTIIKNDNEIEWDDLGKKTEIKDNQIKLPKLKNIRKQREFDVLASRDNLIFQGTVDIKDKVECSFPFKKSKETSPNGLYKLYDQNANVEQIGFSENKIFPKQYETDFLVVIDENTKEKYKINKDKLVSFVERRGDTSSEQLIPKFINDKNQKPFTGQFIYLDDSDVPDDSVKSIVVSFKDGIISGETEIIYDSIDSNKIEIKKYTFKNWLKDGYFEILERDKTDNYYVMISGHYELGKRDGEVIKKIYNGEGEMVKEEIKVYDDGVLQN